MMLNNFRFVLPHKIISFGDRVSDIKAAHRMKLIPCLITLGDELKKLQALELGVCYFSSCVEALETLGGLKNGKTDFVYHDN
ncbi:MAG: hypothetical protein QXF61_02400 [Nitrososphaeria archaeon]